MRWVLRKRPIEISFHFCFQGCNSLSSLLQPLRSLHKVIFTLVNCIQEGEAVVEAFVEELEDVKLPEMENDNVVVPDSKDATEIERELKRVLIENQGMCTALAQ